MTISTLSWAVLASGGFGLFYALLLAVWLSRRGGVGATAQSVAKPLNAGAKAYWGRAYVALALLAVPLAFALTPFGQWTANGFIVGALASVLAAHIGAAVAAGTGVRVTACAGNGFQAALNAAFKGGSVVGVATAALALLAVAGYYWLARAAIPADQVFRALIGLGLGGAVASLFIRIVGGIYAQASRAGASGQADGELDLALDDPRNPAAIAHTLGGSLGGSAGLAADVYESTALALVASMLLAKTAFGEDSPWVEFPLLVAAVAVLASALGGVFVRLGRRKRVLAALYRGLLAAGLLAGAGFYAAIDWFLALPGVTAAFDPLSLFAIVFCGLVLTGFVLLATEYRTAPGFKPAKRVAAAAAEGSAANAIAGLAVGQKAALLPVLLASADLGGAYWLGGGFAGNPWAGLYAVALAILATLSLAGVIAALNTYAAIAASAPGIAEMAELHAIKQSVAEPLHAAGHTAKAVAKGYAVVSGGLVGLALFSAYSHALPTPANFGLFNPLVLFGLALGGVLPYWLGARLLAAAGQTASRVGAEVRRQLQASPSLLAGDALPHYARCVETAANSAIRQALVPTLLALAAAPAVGLLAGKEALGGLLVGGIVSGLAQALALTASGGVWHSAKRLIESGLFGGKRSPAHAAASAGAAIGDACQDAVGPTVGALAKVLGIVALLIVPLLG